MKLKGSTIKDILLDLPPPKRAALLARWAHNITVTARAAYPQLTDPRLSVERLVALNEIQHLLTGQLMHMTANDDERYPDDTLIDIVLSQARTENCEHDVLLAFEFSIPGSKEG